ARPPAPETGNDQVRPPTTADPDRTCLIERFPGPKGWTVIEIPSTPDSRDAVHKRRLRFVPRLATAPPRSRRFPPPYPCSRPDCIHGAAPPAARSEAFFFQDRQQASQL
ncbi:hypothetical protein PVAP13_2KG425805, partial [Panicum virgatum]